MGQSPSSLGSKGGRVRRSLRGFGRRSRVSKSGLSYTFSMVPGEPPELMDVNVATEEQLMTLPGVTRQLARDIVKHRRLIGRFKRVDDLALVSGIGADKLEKLRPEICTNSRKNLSRASSCTQSLESVKLSLDSRLCSINSSSVFQLQCVPGLNQELAANIVDYRKKKGPFKSLDDLIKVRGMDIIRLSTIKPHLSLESRKCESVQLLNGLHSNGWCTEPLNETVPNGTPNRTPHRKSSSMPSKLPMTLPNGFSTAPVNDILDLLSAYSHRPIIEEDFKYERNGVRCCRIASWNLHQLSVEKVSNPGVREVICRTILENKLSILAIQDVLEEVALKVICDELNSPDIRRVKEWKANSHRWDYCVLDIEGSKRLGFIFDSLNKSITVETVDMEELIVDDVSSKTSLIQQLDLLQNGQLDFDVYYQAFLICDKPLLLVNVFCEKMLSTEECGQLQVLFELVDKIGLQICVLGEFHTLDNVMGSLSAATGLPPVLSKMDNWQKVDIPMFLATLQALSTGSHSLLDNAVQTSPDDATRSAILCIPDIDRSGFNGTWSTVRSGLCHLAIPRGWSWGGAASPHYPLWAEYNLPE